jgi:carbamoyltransferase
MVEKSAGRFGPRHPQLGRLGETLALPFAEQFFRRRQIHRAGSRFAEERRRAIAAMLARGETVYLAGVGLGGFHNSGVALIEIAPDRGPRIICNNEEERFSGKKHASHFPAAALDALGDIMRGLGIGPERIAAWLGTFDYPLFVATGIRAILEEFPAGLKLLSQEATPGFDPEQFREGFDAPVRLSRIFGLSDPAPVIGVPHHDDHAFFSYFVSPFARQQRPAMVLVVDGAGDCASISAYVGCAGTLEPVRNNGSLFDSLGHFYSVISATQGGWTILSSEGRYMGAAAYGDMGRTSNPFYANMRKIFDFAADGEVRLNRDLANWHRDDMLRNPYTPALAEILGPPIAPENMWNPEAVLRVDDVEHQPHTQTRVDKAAATQLVFEDALAHIVDWFIRATGSDRLVLTGGAALNAVANMRLLETFDEDYYGRVLGRDTRLHLWVPPVPSDCGVALGAAYAFAASAGAGLGPPMRHAFYCGRGATSGEILSALRSADDVEWTIAGDAARRSGREAIAALMASITAQDGIIGIVQGPAETGPRALGHRSILASATNPRTRELINARVKYREPIRPLAPMATLAAAKELFELNDGAADDDYNAYNYMVQTVRAKPAAWRKVPAVIHVDGTARIQIVRVETDPVIYAYLKALCRRTGVEVAVNTSFNVGAPIAQSTAQAIETLRRAKGMDGVFLFSDDGPVVVAWMKQPPGGAALRMRDRLSEWQSGTRISVDA